jgi:hypothetical protein
MPIPISLTDEQLHAVMRAAAPLLPSDRGPFLEEVARELAALPDIGDGALHRVVATVQRRHFDPPRESGNHAGPRHLGSNRRSPHLIRDDND